VLVIGLGSGTTSGASLLFPETSVACAEIEPAVARASAHFEGVNHRPFASERFALVLNDGRAHLQGARARYDLILSEPSNPWMAGVSNLFTLEFYRAVRDRLAPGGVLAQWIQAYSLTPSDYALVARTVLEVFPHGLLLRLPGTDTILLASERPLDPERDAVERAQALVDSLSPVKADLERWLGTADVRSLLVRHRLLGDAGLRSLLARDGGRGINTDRDLRLEFDAPLRLFDRAVDSSEVEKSLLFAADTEVLAALWKRWGCGPSQAAALRELTDHFAARGEWDRAESLLELGLRLDPPDP
jgi:hypothetical protein